MSDFLYWSGWSAQHNKAGAPYHPRAQYLNMKDRSAFVVVGYLVPAEDEPYESLAGGEPEVSRSRSVWKQLWDIGRLAKDGGFEEHSIGQPEQAAKEYLEAWVIEVLLSNSKDDDG